MNRHEFLTAIAGFAMVPFAANGLFAKKEVKAFPLQPFTDRAVAYAPTTMASCPTVAMVTISSEKFDKIINSMFNPKREIS